MTDLARVRYGFALSFLNVGAEDFPEVGDGEDAIGAFDDRLERVFAVEVSLGTGQNGLLCCVVERRNSM